MENEEVVLSAPLFANIEPSEARALLGSMTPVRLSKGEVLFREGALGNQLFVITSGKIKLGRSSQDGRENLLAVLGPGEMLGELSLFDPGPRTATATAVSDSELLELPHDRLASWITTHPAVATPLLGALAGRLRRTDEALADLVFSDVPGRVAKALLDLAERFGQKTSDGIRVTHELTQEELAQLVGASRETVNKALADFTTRKWVRRDGRTLILVELERLQRRSR
ncbi:cAMP-binding domain of CRP or a regulatory subunit of cAMP-dependent protein kinases [Micrococcales bacterium KH10]|nr:cAMP-binding domain of CRP or a regulatory subunit of cAMP-dependent protein kinases [Micrococcales bacterium KH10]